MEIALEDEVFVIDDQLEAWENNMDPINMINLLDNMELNFNDDFSSDFDDDDDYFNDDISDLVSETSNKIYYCLEDSQVFKRFRFHKEGERYRLPRTSPNKFESLESLFHLLTEVEILMKTWKKRIHHAFTVHLEPENIPKSSPPNQNEFEIEDDDDGEGSEHLGTFYDDSKKTEIDSSLTKRKFCYSAKIFYEIFKNEDEFEKLLCHIRSIRKEVYNTIFQKFMNILPNNVMEKLPAEIWDKIWKYTQVDYDEEKSLHVGINSDNEEMNLRENKLITDLFGSVGNIHMILFELLFQNPYILNQGKLFEMESVPPLKSNGIKDVSYPKYLFNWYIKALFKSYNAFTIFTGISPIEKDIQKIDSGLLSIRKKVIVDKSQNDFSDHMCNIFFFILSQFSNNLIGYIENKISNPIEDKVIIHVWDVIQNKVAYEIQTDIKPLNILGVNNNNTSDLFYLFKKSLVYATIDQKEDLIVSIKKWKLDVKKKLKDFDAKDLADSIRFKINQDNGNSNKGLITIKGTDHFDDERDSVLCLCFYDLNERKSHIRYIDVESLEYLKNMDMDIPGKITLRGINGTRAIFSQEKNIIFVDVKTAQIICEYKFEDFCAENHHIHDDNSCCSYVPKFDQNENRKEFVIYNRNFESFYLYNYESEENKIPKIIAKGNSYAYDFDYVSFNKVNVNLVNGKIFFSNTHAIHKLNYPSDLMKIECTDVAAIDCHDCSLHPIQSFLMSNDKQIMSCFDKILMNGLSHDTLTECNVTNFVHFYKENAFIIPSGIGYVSIEFIKNFKKQSQPDENIKNIIKEKTVLQGRIIRWNYTYGFIKPLSNTPKKLKNVFFHQSDVCKNSQGKKISLRSGLNVSFKIDYCDNNHSMKAVEINIKD